MKTRILQIDPLNLKPEILEEAVFILRRGGLVAFPTETVYGLGGDTFKVESIKKIYKTKGRPIDNPLIVHISSLDEVDKVVKEIPDMAYKLMEIFFPGPLTLILPRKEDVPPEVSAFLPTVAVRMPAHPVALTLIKLLNSPIAAPSANKSSRVSPVTASHVYEELKGEIDLILDGGKTPLGLESTVVDLTKKLPFILRPGVISLEELREFIPSIEEINYLDSSDLLEKPLSPGMKYKHYSPKIPLILFTGSIPNLWQEIQKEKIEREDKGERVGLLLTEEGFNYLGKPKDIAIMGSINNPMEVASRLYLTLRDLEKEFTAILVEGLEEKGVGRAIMNRLKKASCKIIKV